MTDLASRQLDGRDHRGGRRPSGVTTLDGQPSATTAVFIDTAMPVAGHQHVGADKHDGALQAVRHLLDVHGHDTVALLMGRGARPTTDEREIGWRHALRAAGRPEGSIVYAPFTQAGRLSRRSTAPRRRSSTHAPSLPAPTCWPSVCCAPRTRPACDAARIWRRRLLRRDPAGRVLLAAADHASGSRSSPMAEAAVAAVVDRPAGLAPALPGRPACCADPVAAPTGSEDARTSRRRPASPATRSPTSQIRKGRKRS